MERQKFKATRLLAVIALCCALIAGNFVMPNMAAEAATKKTAISAASMTIPVGKMESKVYWNKNIYELSNAQKLTVKNTVKGATYQFTSSDTKVVKVGKDGGYLTGVKAGTATITCIQTYKNKKTTVGKCKVTVKNAALKITEFGNEYAIGTYGYNLSDYFAALDPLFSITYRNPGASYTLTSSDKNLAIKEIKYDASKAKDVSDSKEYQEVMKDYIGKAYFYGYEFTAKKAGTYTITVKETYNKKTKTVGSFKIVIKAASVSDSKVDLLLGNNLNAFNLLSFPKQNTPYYFSINNYDAKNPDNNAVTLVKNGSELYLYANKTGTAEVTIREESEKGTVIGTVKVAVSEAPCENITVDSEYTTYVGDYFNIYYELEPWDTTDKVTIESNNPKVLKVAYNEEYEEWEYTPLKVGEANITIQCGDQSVVCKVIVEEW